MAPWQGSAWGRAAESSGALLEHSGSAAWCSVAELGHGPGHDHNTRAETQPGVGGEGSITAHSGGLAPQGAQMWTMSLGEASHRDEFPLNPGCHMSLCQLLHPLPCPCPNSSKCCHVSVPAASTTSVPIPTLSSTDKCPYPNTSIHSCVPSSIPPPCCVLIPSEHDLAAVPVAATSPCPRAVTCGIGGCHGHT